jgi:isopenicillin N synthase-like dioxygenase
MIEREVVFAGEALSVALGACMPFRAPVQRVQPDTSEPRISITFKARVNMSAVFKPPPVLHAAASLNRR